jgi:hypothetical protein
LNKEFAFLPVVPCGTTIFTNLPEVENRKGIYRCTCMCCAWSCILYIKLNLCVCLCLCVCVCVPGIEIHTVEPILTKFGMGA